jgi:protoheme IX farnesyltransferase
LLKDYYWLVKPGIVYSNVMAAAAGFLLGSKWQFRFITFIAALIGTSLVVACGCVLNNYMDRGIDKKMSRTKKRALAAGRISGKAALAYAAGLGIAGFAVLGAYTNGITVGVGAVGLFAYVVLYGAGKRRSTHGTLIGTISGATPLVAGYTAALDRLDRGALVLFLIMVCWQMPHFYAIALYRLKDYQSAGLPVLPAVKGPRRTKLEILAYVFGFILTVILLSLLGYAGVSFAVIMAGLGIYWLWRGLKGFNAKDDTKWGRQMFGLSLLIIMSLSVMLAVGSVLP